MLARDQSSGEAGMIRVTRDKTKLRGDDFVTFWVELELPSSPNEMAAVRGACTFHDPEQGSVASTQWLPVEEAFGQACDFAKKKDFSAIWIDDPDLRFVDGDINLWVQRGLIDYLDDHS
jgi:hypothetical protein